MRDKFLEIKNYIDEIGFYDSQENFEYEHYPYLKNILDDFTAKQHEAFVEEVFEWPDHQLEFVASFLDFTDYDLKGKYESYYVFCECFSKINDVQYLEYLFGNLEVYLTQRRFLEDHLSLSIQYIINNLYLLINNSKDQRRINSCLRIIKDLES